MQRYELVLLLDHAMKKDERDGIVNELEVILKPFFLDKDDIGIKQLSYNLSRDKQKDSAYFISYYLELDINGIELIKKHLLYNKSILRYSFFRMNKTEEFMKFEKVQKDLEKIIEGWGKQRFGQKITFYADVENKKYLIWKSIPMLKKYVTRFGDIKPRRYTKSTVAIQKKIRKSIIRAKELGLMKYVV